MRFGRIFLAYFILSLFIVLAPNVYATSSSDTLKGYWKFDESSGNASDSSGDGVTLTNSNVTYTTGQINNAASFNGTNSGFSGTGPNLANSSFTISGWLYLNDMSVDRVWFNLGSSSSSNAALHLRITTTGAVHMGFFLNDLDTAAGVFTTGSWHQVIYTYDSSNRNRKIYVDGVQKASGTASANFTGNTVLTIGSWGGAERWNGLIDETKVYNRVLSSTEIAALAAGGHTAATWTGTTSQNWELASNWDIGAIPDPYTTITIPSVSNYPVMSANESASGVTVNSGAFLDKAGFTLSFTDSGSLTNNGTVYTNGAPVNPSLTAAKPGGSSFVCTSQAPAGVPNLFQTTTTGNSVELTFTTVSGSTGYQINYGLTPDANQYGENFDYSGPLWILNHSINMLSHGTDYYFRVRASSCCNAGEWSQTIKVKTLNNQNRNLVLGTSTLALDTSFCIYIVTQNDTLWSIAQRKWGSGIKYLQISKLNPEISSETLLKIGQKLSLCS